MFVYLLLLCTLYPSSYLHVSHCMADLAFYFTIKLIECDFLNNESRELD